MITSSGGILSKSEQQPLDSLVVHKSSGVCRVWSSSVSFIEKYYLADVPFERCPSELPRNHWHFGARIDLKKELSHCDMLVNVAITGQESVQWLIHNSKNIPNVLCFQSSPSLINKLGGTFVQYTGEQDLFGKLINVGKPSGTEESTEVLKTISNAWERHNSDDIRFCLLVVVNAYIRPVAMLKNLRAKGLSTLGCMITNCGPQILNCLFDRSNRIESNPILVLTKHKP